MEISGQYSYWPFLKPRKTIKMRLLIFLLAPFLGYSQVSGVFVYKTKEVHKIGWRDSGSTSSWNIDTIRYHVPFEIKFLQGKISIDGYGTFKIDSVKQKYNSPYWNYWLSDGKQFALIENYGYLNYPTVKKKSQIVIFYLE